MTTCSMKLILSLCVLPYCGLCLPAVVEEGGQEQSRRGGISFHLRTIYQQDSSNPTAICGSSKAGGRREEMEGRGWKRVKAPLALSPRYSGKQGGRGKLQASVEPHGRPIRAAPPPCLMTSSAPWRAHLGWSWDLYVQYDSLCIYRLPPLHTHLLSQKPPLQEAKCQAPAAVFSTQDGSLVESQPYVTGSGKDREHSPADYSNSIKQQHPLTAVWLSLHCL